MTVGEIRSVVNGYAQKSVSDFTVDLLDLTILAMNHARKRAERLHDFSLQDYSVLLDVDPTDGGLFSDAVEDIANEIPYTPRIKTLQTVYLVDETDSNVRYPLYHHGKKNVAVWTKELNYRDTILTASRHPGDVSLLPYPNQIRAVISGERLRFDPAFEVTRQAALDANLWLPDYDDSVDGLLYTDWFTEQASDYLLWASIIELNKLMLKFAPRADGYLPEPTKDRDEAFQTLVEWDNFRIEQGRQPFARR